MRILILEDDPLTALDLQCLVEDCGHEVVGLCQTVADAGRRIGDGLDFALLDVDLPDGKSFALAERLHRSRVPFAFVSASRRSEVPADLQGAPFIPKPYQHAAIRNSLAEAGGMPLRRAG
ncbi:response regulator [Enterovirga aerilata]|uniref:Response regulator n=1 Tax=Enterovirga aerilata TaxID=2730920 RepID=A0A849IB85_9HYPH|nr:response regulator [Enterovirga sp. DB1703]NNM73679.1 response regulator [Enterovirga sp. DB1703]